MREVLHRLPCQQRDEMYVYEQAWAVSDIVGLVVKGPPIHQAQSSPQKRKRQRDRVRPANRRVLASSAIFDRLLLERRGT